MPPVPSVRAAVRGLIPFALQALARDVDSAVGLLLRSSLDLPDFVRQALRLVDPVASLGHVALWTVGGAVLWTSLAFQRAPREGGSFAMALEPVSRGFAPLYLRPALTLLGLASLALQPSYPYAFTLPVALTQDLGVAHDAASLGLIAFVVYALLTPSWARHWDGHPGNEPKTLRIAVAIGHGLTLDV